MIDTVTHSEGFAGWLDADGAEVLDRRFEIIDGHAACIEQWRIEGNEGETIVMNPEDIPGLDESAFVDWLREHWVIAGDAIVSRERGVLASHHRFQTLIVSRSSEKTVGELYIHD